MSEEPEADASRLDKDFQYRRLIITLVPGTWGRNGFWGRKSRKPRWFDPQSDFYRQLTKLLAERKFSHEISSLEWSCENSVYERDVAARQLAANLLEAAKNDNKSLQVVIAHSHAGNIALRAAEKCSTIADRLAIVTLASPFLQIRVGPLVSDHSTYLRATAGLILLSLLILFWALFELSIGWLFSVLTVSIFMILILIATLVALTFRFLNFKPFEATNHLVDRLIGMGDAPTASERAFKLSLAATYDLTNIKPARILIVRGIDDEAASAITIGNFSSRTIALISSWIGTVCVFISVIGGYAFIAIMLFWKEHLTNFLTYAAIGSVTLCGLFLFLLTSALACKAVYGRELFLGSALCDMSVNSAPDCSRENNLEIITLDAPASGLRHSIYNASSCLPEIVAWLSRTCTDGATLAGQRR